ncbi:MAG: hypothetical protein IT320_09445 [Anaerolineae bacterium]|nr:hypothetical protein [Anaerolineae bacterium]
MAVILNTIENEGIVRLQTSETWTVNEMMTAVRKAAAICSQSPQPMHMLIDVSQTQRLPDDMLRPRIMADVAQTNHSYVVIVGANALVRTVANAFAIMMQSTRVQHFNTIRDAMDYLRQVSEAERIIIA